MVAGLINLVSYGLSSGGTVGNFLYRLENLGFFSYVLPFLIIFAIVFAILDKIQFLGNKKGINVVLALSVSLMSLQFQFVSYFFSEIFPRMGVLLSIILVAIILLSLFLNFKNKYVKVFIGGIVFIGFIIIVLQSFSSSFPWGGILFNSPFWWEIQTYLPQILTGVFVIGILFAVIGKKADPARSKKLKTAIGSMAQPEPGEQ